MDEPSAPGAAGSRGRPRRVWRQLARQVARLVARRAMRCSTHRLVAAAGVVALALEGSAAPALRAQAVRGEAARPRLQSDSTRAARPDTALRVVSGRVVRPTAAGTVPVPGLWVTLHRVGSDRAGPLDSVRTGPGGAYLIEYRQSGATDAIYFVSARYGGVAYFSPPLQAARVTGLGAELTVFDTTSRPFPLTARGRHIVVSTPARSGMRDVMEVYEISNDSATTLVPAGDSAPVWSARTLPRATGFEVAQGDFAPQALTADGGRVFLSAPMAPGIKQLSFTYRVPASVFPASLPIVAPTQVVEVLTEEPRAVVSGAGLAAVPSATVEGRIFSRYLARDVPANSVVRIAVPQVSAAPSGMVAILALGIGAAMLAALAALAVRRHRALAALPATREPPDHPDQLARAVAVLDRDFAARAAPTAAERERYQAERLELKARLARSLERRRSMR